MSTDTTPPVSPNPKVLTTPDLLKAILKSKLVDKPTLQRALGAVRTKLGGTLPDSGVPVAELLVASGMITEWHATHLLQGRTKGFFLGKYKLIQHLGSGGMASVYLGEHSVMRTRNAIKVLPKDRVEKPGSLERFQDEARTAALLDHPNIVRTIDIDSVGDRHFMVMEFIDGSDLERVTRKSEKLSVPKALGYLRQAALGLQHAHERGVLHRDVKPLNMLINRDGILKVSDFGLARLRHDFNEELANEQNTATVVGTADYMAPEQARNSNTIDGRADLYALGATLYFMLAGKPMYTGGTLRDRLAQHQMDPAPNLLEANPNVPEDIISLYQRLVDKQPANRYQTATELIGAIDRIVAQNEIRLAEASPLESLGNFAPVKTTAGSHSDALADLAADPSGSGPISGIDSFDHASGDDPFGSSVSGLDLSSFDDEGASTLQPLKPLAPAQKKKKKKKKSQGDGPLITEAQGRLIGMGVLAAIAAGVMVWVFATAQTGNSSIDASDMLKLNEGDKKFIIVDDE